MTIETRSITGPGEGGWAGNEGAPPPASGDSSAPDLNAQPEILEDMVVNPVESAPELVDPLRSLPEEEPPSAGISVDEALGKSFRKHVEPYRREESRPKRKQLADIERALADARSNLIRQFQANAMGDAAASDPEHGDVCDLSAQDIARNMSLSLRERDRMKLHAIEEALERIREGTYGICEDCEDPIPVGRLQIMPFATTCVSCQSRQERVEKLSRQAGGIAGSNLYSHELAATEE